MAYTAKDPQHFLYLREKKVGGGKEEEDEEEEEEEEKMSVWRPTLHKGHG